MKLVFLIVIILQYFIHDTHASNYGTSGIIDVPDARMLNDGDLRITLSNKEIANILYINLVIIIPNNFIIYHITK